MPEPIGSRPYTPAAAPEPLACQDDTTSAQPSAGAEALTCRAPLDDRAAAPQPKPQGIAGPNAEAHAASDDLYAGAFVLKGRDAKSGVELEVFSVSAHEATFKSAFPQEEAQAGMARIGMSSDDGHFNVRGEVFTAKAHAGMQNPDGSVGFNAGVGVTAVGAEGTATLGPVSATAGASVSLNLAGSLGIRDGDHDGKSEICGRAELAVLTLGACIEKFW